MLIPIPIVAFATRSDGKSFACEYFTQTKIKIKIPIDLCAIDGATLSTFPTQIEKQFCGMF